MSLAVVYVKTLQLVIGMVLLVTASAFFLNGSEPVQKSPHPSASGQTLVATRSTMQFALHHDSNTKYSRLTLSNEGSRTVHSPRIIINDERNWYNIQSILQEILQGKSTDKEKALAIWAFLKDNTIHNGPAHAGQELHDPVRYLNVYGYGYCDDTAYNLAQLATMAGFRSRVWALRGHVVPEVFFNDKWHVLDADLKLLYRDTDNSILGVQDLISNPKYLHEHHADDPKLANQLEQIYTTRHNNRVRVFRGRLRNRLHTMAFSLRPGESVTYSREPRGRYFHMRKRGEPQRYANGQFQFRPRLTKKRCEKDASLLKNIHFSSLGVSPKESHLGELGYQFQYPYPVLHGTVMIKGAISKKGHLQVFWHRTRKRSRRRRFNRLQQRQKIFVRREEGSFQKQIPLTAFRTSGPRYPDYAYEIRLQLEGDIVITSLTFTSIVQMAPKSIPTLQPGENSVVYNDTTTGPRKIRISFIP